MRYVLINPVLRTATAGDYASLQDAEVAAGLDPGAVDHGMITRSIGYVVYEFGLFVPPAQQHYFAMGRGLIAGAAVLYGVDAWGESVNLHRSTIPDIRWFLGMNDVEAAIEAGEIIRPETAINGVVTWRWPDAHPIPDRSAR
jgi:hypothetical protein